MGTTIDQEGLNEVVVLGDNDTILLIGNGADLCIRCAIPLRQIERMPGVVSGGNQPASKPARKLGINKASRKPSGRAA